jgi:hypothetical protein
MPMRLRLPLCFLVLCHWLRAAEPMAEFEKKVRPLLVEHCVGCHGPEKQKGGLRLDHAAGWKQGGDSGPALVPGDPTSSLLMKALSHADRDLKMPPKGKLPDSAVRVLEEWIATGAADPRTEASAIKGKDTLTKQDHWAFKLPKKHPIPPVKDQSWPRNPVDHFILAGLESKGMQPAADADATTLLRRLSYDITGLPPAALVANPSTTLVDRLLHSTAYAERWAQHWLDAARFAESSGGGRSLPFKDAWRYRDYVIESMAEGKPLDRFITEQVAGDLLPFTDAAQRRKHLVATGYLVLGAHNYEEQDKVALRMDMVDEQLETLGRSLLGMTLGCARCHDHKFDPIPTADYYALAGILRSTKLIRDTKENVAHWIEQPLPLDGAAESEMVAHEAKLAKAEAAVAEAKKRLKKLTPKTEPTDGGKRPLTVDELPGVVVDDSAAKQVGAWQKSTRYPTYVGEGYLHDDDTSKGELTLSFVPEIPAAGSYEVRFSYTSTTGRASNVPLRVQHADGETEVTVDESALPPLDGRFISLGQFRFEAGSQGFVMLSNEGTNGHVTADAVVFIPAEELPGLAAKEETVVAAGSELAVAQKEVKSAEQELKSLQRSHPARPEAMAVAEHEEQGDSPIHIRGSSRNLGKPVPRGVLQAAYHEPVALKIPKDQSGRLELAGWLTSARNPLTARVLANRVWMHLFGEGLVRSADNFGTTGDLPTHPELLDHLALYLMEQGWELRSLIRYITSSRAYQMSSVASTANRERDPDNALLHSQRRRRLDAQAIRDTMLVAAGRLDPGFLGPNIQNAPKAKDSNDNTLQGLEYGYVFNDLRRSVYTPAFRNKRLELFEVFDFADINQSLAKRNTSTVSTQALFMMNHSFVHEQAGAAAQALLAKSELSSDEARVLAAYGAALSRAPTAAERRLALDFVQSSPGDETATQQERWTLLLQTLFACADFRYLE